MDRRSLVGSFGLALEELELLGLLLSFSLLCPNVRVAKPRLAAEGILTALVERSVRQLQWKAALTAGAKLRG